MISHSNNIDFSDWDWDFSIGENETPKQYACRISQELISFTLENYATASITMTADKEVVIDLCIDDGSFSHFRSAMCAREIINDLEYDADRSDGSFNESVARNKDIAISKLQKIIDEIRGAKISE